MDCGPSSGCGDQGVRNGLWPVHWLWRSGTEEWTVACPVALGIRELGMDCDPSRGCGNQGVRNGL